MEEVIIKQMTGNSQKEKATIEKEIKIHTKLMQPEDSSEYFCQLIDYTKQKGAGGAILEQHISRNDEKLVITPSQRREVATTWKCKCTIDNPVDKKVCLLGCC